LWMWGKFFSMIFTSAAANRVKELLTEEGQSTDTALRIFVEGGGCHGFSYGFGFETDIANDDTVYETEGVKLVVDSMSIMYLDSATVDYISSVHGDRFTIDNPEAVTTCGCGSSFSM
jgi:iron-sulfur cluster insertion protein